MMYRSIYSFTAILYFVPACLSAVVFAPLSNTELVKCTFSNRHHNRIVVEDGRIQKVIFPEGRLGIKLEDESGQVFISASSPQNQSSTISVVTDTGIVQDVELSFSNIPSEVLVLKQFECEAEITPKVFCPQDNATIVQEILSGMVPEGFTSYDNEGEEIKIKRCITAKNVGTLVGDEESIFIFEVKNKGFGTTQISEKDFEFCQGSWVYIGDSTIPPRRKTVAIVSVRKS